MKKQPTFQNAHKSSDVFTRLDNCTVLNVILSASVKTANSEHARRHSWYHDSQPQGKAYSRGQ